MCVLHVCILFKIKPSTKIIVHTEAENSTKVVIKLIKVETAYIGPTQRKPMMINKVGKFDLLEDEALSSAVSKKKNYGQLRYLLVNSG